VSIKPVATPEAASSPVPDRPVVEAVAITKRFGKVTALDNVCLAVYPGEFLTLLGPSGCGKTTLLRIIAGFETPTEGRVLLRGTDVTALPPEKRPLNMVFQRYALFPHLTVAENVAFGLRLRHMPDAQIRERVTQALALVRLEGFDARLPHQVSGGQAQRVALARALVNQPEVLLLDEPLSALDRKIRMQMQDELRLIQAKVGTTFIYVTHDQDEAMAMSTRVVLLRDGVITQIASPQALYQAPASEFAANFIGDANLLEGHVMECDGGLAVAWCGLVLDRCVVAGRSAGEIVRLMVRPEAIRLRRRHRRAELVLRLLLDPPYPGRRAVAYSPRAGRCRSAHSRRPHLPGNRRGAGGDFAVKEIR
jgi:spermidine/putrescine transport system ATP-binding protein